MRRSPARSLLLLPLLLGSAGASAAVFCVGNSSQLAQVLAQSSGDGQADEIRLFIGHYAPGSGGFLAQLGAGDELLISGGWFGFGPCNTWNQLGDVRLTVLDGLGAFPALAIDAGAGAGDISVANLSAINGQSGNHHAGGISIANSASFHGDIRIDRVWVDGNSAPLGFSGGILAQTGDGTVHVRGSVVTNNLGLEAGGLRIGVGGNGQAFASNNDVYFNVANDTWAGGVQCVGSGPCTVANSLMRSNFGRGQHPDSAQGDVLANANMTLLHSSYAVITGTPNAASDGNTQASIGVKLVDGLWRPSGGATLTDTGLWPVPGGALTVDHGGDARVLSGAIDIGAYEYAGVLRDGFEQAPGAN